MQKNRYLLLMGLKRMEVLAESPMRPMLSRLLQLRYHVSWLVFSLYLFSISSNMANILRGCGIGGCCSLSGCKYFLR